MISSIDGIKQKIAKKGLGEAASAKWVYFNLKFHFN